MPLTKSVWFVRAGIAVYLVFQCIVLGICVKWLAEKHLIIDAVLTILMAAATLSYLSYKFTFLRNLRILPIDEKAVPDVIGSVVTLLFAQRWFEQRDVGDAVGTIFLGLITCIGIASSVSRYRKPSRIG